jgi:hypothetical protein|tara:strand:+ start:55885 stop:56325 length:441 start_codon:yes stop_codon:yes gene_type:complete
MIEDLENDAKAELKRADHLLYVTLKYTRTADIIKSIISRLLFALDFAIADILEKLKEKKKIKVVPKSKIERVDLFSKISKSREIKDYINFYFLLRKIDKSSYKAKEEYRKNVTLINQDFDVNLTMIKLYYNKTKRFIEFAMDYPEK